MRGTIYLQAMARHRILILAGFFLLALAPPGLSQGVRFQKVDRNTIEARLHNLARRNAEREQKLKQMFASTNCSDENLVEQPVKGSRLPNVICTLPSNTTSVIIVAAHFDHAEAGEGAVDNWSGASLLPSLYESIKQEPRRHTFVFIGFTGEEDGLVGSKFYVKQLTPDQKARIAAMVNLDSLGLAPTEIWFTRSDPTLARAIGSVAQAMHLPVSAVNVEQVGTADSESFASAKIPRITIHSVTQDTLRILHSPQDTLAAIKFDDYYQTYQLLAGYLAYLDSALNPAPAPATAAAH